MTLVSKSFSEIVTFSRSSNATRIGPTGLVEYAPHNLIPYSQDFTNVAWGKSNSSVTANAIAAPDGTITADKIDETAASAPHQFSASPVMALNTLYTLSIYAKAAERNWVILNLYTGANSCWTWFNISSGSVGTVGAGATASIQSVGNGWFRCSISISTASSGFPNIAYWIANADGSINYAGTAGSGIYVWGAQLSVGPYALDYTPTTSAAVYGPRFDYDPVTLAARGLLVEEQRTNLVTYSEDFSNAAWSKSGSSVTANAVVSPDGTVTADTLTTTSTSTPECYQLVSGSASTTYTMSCFFKAGTYTKTWVRCYNGGSTTTPLALFDLSAKSIIATYGNVTSASVQDYGNGWVRCIMTFTTTGSSLYPLVLGLANSYTVDPTYNYPYNFGSLGSVYAWGAQVEAGSFASSYIPTLASTVTRSADVASVNTLSPWFNATEGTLFAEANIIGKSVFNNPSAFFTDGTENNAIYTLNNPGTAVVVSGGATQFDSTAVASTSVNTTYKAALAFKANDFATSYNGSAPTTDTSGSVPTVSALYLGRRVSGGGSLNGHLRRVAFYPRRLTNAEIQALTS